MPSAANRFLLPSLFIGKDRGEKREKGERRDVDESNIIGS